MPDEPHLLEQVGQKLALRHQVQPLRKLLGPRAAQQPALERTGADEHVLHAAVDDLELVDGPEQPVEPRLGHERRDAERPRAFGPQAERRGDLLAREPAIRRGRDARRDDVDPSRLHTPCLAAAGHRGRYRDHAVGMTQRPRRRRIARPERHLADEPCSRHERPRRRCEHCLRAAAGMEHRGPQPAGDEREPCESAAIHAAAPADAMHRKPRLFQPAGRRAPGRREGQMDVIARFAKAFRRELHLPAGADRIEPAGHQQDRSRRRLLHAEERAEADGAMSEGSSAATWGSCRHWPS